MNIDPSYHLLRRVFQESKRPLAFTYTLTLLENGLRLSYPLATGYAINGLLQQNPMAVLPFCVIWMAHAIVGIERHRFDTRVFSRMYGRLATSVVLEQRAHGVSTSEVAARSTLAREVVDAFEHDLPVVMAALVSFAGAIGILFAYDAWIGALCLVLLAPTWIVNRRFARQSHFCTAHLNDELEREVDVVAHGEPGAITNHYDTVGRWRIELSDAEARTWGVMEAFVLLVTLGVLLRAVQLPHLQVGDLYAVMAYTWNFAQSLSDVPYLVQQFSRVRDIGRRVSIGIIPASPQPVSKQAVQSTG